MNSPRVRRGPSLQRQDSLPDTWDSKVDKFAVVRAQKERLELFDDNYNSKKHFEVIDGIFTVEKQKAKLDADAPGFLRRYRPRETSTMRVETLMQELRERIRQRETAVAQQGVFFRKSVSAARPVAIVERNPKLGDPAKERK